MSPIRGNTACLFCIFLLKPYFKVQEIKVLCVPFRHHPTLLAPLGGVKDPRQVPSLGGLLCCGCP